MEIQLVKDFKKLSLYRHNWDKLLRSYSGKDVFLTYEWITTWWEHFGENNELYILFIWDEKRLVGIAPLMKLSKGPFRIIQFIGHPRHSDRMDFIIDETRYSEVIEAIVHYLMDRKKDWHLISLRQFSTLTNTSEMLADISTKYNIQFLHQPDDPCFYIPLSKYNGFDQYLEENYSSKNIRDFRRLKRKIIKNNFKKCDYYSLHNDSNIYSQIVDLDRNRSIRGKQGLSFFSDVRNIDFLKEIIDKFSYLKTIKIKTYMKEKKIICYLLVFIFNSKIMAYQAAFNFQYSQYSPGTMLNFDAIEDAFKTGCREYDFLMGEEGYKSRWTHNYRQNKRILIYNSQSLSKLLYQYHKRIKPLRPLIKQSKIGRRLGLDKIKIFDI